MVADNRIPIAPSSMANYYGQQENLTQLFLDKITASLHKEFGMMPLSVHVFVDDHRQNIVIEVSFGWSGNYYCVGTSILRTTITEAVNTYYALQLVVDVAAEELIRRIRKDISDSMFGPDETKEDIPDEWVKKEKAFRKILV